MQEAPDTVILAEDEATLYLQATTTAVWAQVGATPTVRVDAGRAKTHFYGTLSLQTGQELVTRSDKMNSTITAVHLQTILDAHPDRPILLIWDRAPWHRGAAVRDLLAANPRLEILYLPTAAPDLNPQEQVWKATRRAVSHNHTVPDLPALADQFEAHLRTTTFTSTVLSKYGYHVVCPM